MIKSHKNITEALNNTTSKSVRWCTPSIEFNSEKVKNYYLSDMSVSFEALGFPTEPSGIFKDAYDNASKAYKSDKTLFSVNGSTGSNFIVLRSLAKQIPNIRVLAQRNIHKSILHASQDYGINLIFLETHVDPHLQIFMPNTIREITRAVEKTKPHVLLLTNPTYEGLTLNLKKVIQSVRKINPSIIIFVDEAWGAHLTFSKNLPLSAMESGADICVQSTHKQGGALQQAGMIHWKEERIDSELILESYRNLSTSSPSYLLMASLDSTREYMEEKGMKSIDRSLELAQKFVEQLEKIHGFEVVKINQLKKKLSVFDKDETRIILDVSKSGYAGFELAQILEEKYNIIVEKYNASTLLFLVPFQSVMDDVNKTIKALKEILQERPSILEDIKPHHMEIPVSMPKILDLSEVAKLFQNQVEVIPLKEAKGRISAENITPYPPGIPTTVQGEEFTAKAIQFYENLHFYPNSHVIAHDITLQNVLVVK